MKAKNIPKKGTFPLLRLKTWLGWFLMSLYIVPALTCVTRFIIRALYGGRLSRLAESKVHVRALFQYNLVLLPLTVYAMLGFEVRK